MQSLVEIGVGQSWWFPCETISDSLDATDGQDISEPAEGNEEILIQEPMASPMAPRVRSQGPEISMDR